MPQPFASIVEALRTHAEEGCPSTVSYVIDGEHETESLSFAQLDRRAAALAAVLQEYGASGERVIVIQPPGLHYMASVLGCFYAGATLVPAFTPASMRAARAAARLRAIAHDARARFVLTSTNATQELDGTDPLAELRSLTWIDVGTISPDAADRWREHRPAPSDLAVIQYTSGSTADPRGVMLTHANLAANISAVAHSRSVDMRSQSVVVSWVPLFHDLGLVVMFLGSVHVGCSFVQLDPQHFAQDPMRWLRALTRFRGTHTAAPNFAFDLCARRATRADIEAVDLRSLRAAINGAEPARADTMADFAERFKDCGLDPDALIHHLGMAEHTAYVAGAGRGMNLAGKRFDRAALGRKRAQPTGHAESGRVLLSLGVPPPEHRVAIVDPLSREALRAGQVGEIWVSSGSVGAGYFGQPAATDEIFRARLPGDPATYLRTGDLGFLDDGELYHVGRLKDTIILYGENYYPQDIERSVEMADASVKAGGVAAFEIETQGAAGVAIVAEIAQASPAPDVAERIIANVRRQIAEDHGIHLSAIALTARGSSKKTTSGKIQRRATKAAFLDGSLAPLAIWRDDTPTNNVSAVGLYSTGGWRSAFTYQVEWTPLPSAASYEQKRQEWVFLLDQGGIGARVLAETETAQFACSGVIPASSVGEIHDGASVCAALDRAIAGKSDIRGVVLFSLLDLARDGADPDADATLAAMETIRALAARISERALGPLVVVTRGAERVGEEASTSPWQAAVWGLVRALSFDAPPQSYRLVDLDPSPSADDSPAMAAYLAGVLDEFEVAFRNARRYVPRLERKILVDGIDKRIATTASHPDGAYAVGFDDEGLGVRLGHWLIERGARRLILLARKPTATIERFRQYCGRHEIEATLVRDEECADIAASLRGVVLTVGDNAASDFAGALAAWTALDRAFGTCPGFDYFIVCGRAVGLLGAPAAAAESAAAAFADGIVRRRLAAGLPACGWSFGPIAADPTHSRYLAALGLRCLMPGDVVSMLHIALHGSTLVLPFELAQTLELFPPAADRALYRSLTASPQTTHRHENTAPVDNSPHDELERMLCATFAEALRVDKVGVRDSFFALGGDSLLASGVLAALQERFGLTFAAADIGKLYREFTVETVGALLRTAVKAKIAMQSPEEVRAALAAGTTQ